MQTTYRTRLSRKIIRQSRRRLFLVIVATILIVAGIIKFGIPFLLFISGSSSRQDTTVTEKSPSFISPPTLNQEFTATNSAQIKISGSAGSKQTIDLYVNDQLVDSKSTKDDGTFSFDTVTLKNGDNSVKTQAKVDDKKSDFSNTLTVSYKNKAPSLDVNSPTDGQSFSKDPSIKVTGKTDADAKVTVNDFQAIVDDNGNFTYLLQLQNGDNQIKVVAIDSASNKTEKDLKVTFSQ